jgi:hypothetical protein
MHSINHKHIQTKYGNARAEPENPKWGVGHIIHKLSFHFYKGNSILFEKLSNLKGKNVNFQFRVGNGQFQPLMKLKPLRSCPQLVYQIHSG